MQDDYAADHHPCVNPHCDQFVAFDDEPFCFVHSADGGSHIAGYSYKATHPRK